jgi:hypothetical protein
MRALYRSGWAWAFNGAVNEIEGQCHERDDFSTAI